MLRRLRIAAGLSQEALAERARISVQAVGSLERGVRQAPRHDTLGLLVEALSLDVETRSALENAARVSTKTRIRTSAELERVVSLPHPPTSFIGRERERDDVATLLAPGRCVTLWGTGGIGKTRLVLETARAVLARFPDGVWFVELAPLSDESDVVRAVAVATGVREEDDRSLEDSLVDRLRENSALLVLDNAEHVLLGCAELVDRLLRDAPTIAIACTSREPLRIGGEHVYSLEPLPMPNPGDSLDGAPAVRLFLDRAASAGAAPDERPATLRTIVDICRRLDAIPLAIELASARMPLMTPMQIERGLDDRFRLLTTGSRTAAFRQKTLLDALEWSFALVSERERVVLRRLAVWPGTWTLDDAVALADDGLARWDVIEAVGSLVDRSLVVALPIAGDAERRYRLLYSTAAYALTKLIEASEFDSGRRRQAERVATALASAEEEWRSNDETALRAFEAPPIRAALRWAIELEADPHLGAILAGRSAMFWSLRLQHFEGLRWIADALAHLPDDDVAARTVALIGRARLYKPMLRRRETYDAAAEAMQLADDAGDTKQAAIARVLIADPTSILVSVDQGRRRLEEAADLFERIGDRQGLDSTVWQSAVLAHRYGDYATARKRFATMAARYRSRGMMRLTVSATIGIAEVEFASGNTPAAIERGLEAVADARTIADTVEVGTALQNLAAYYLDAEAVREAAVAARESLDVFFTHGYHMQADISIGHLADVLARSGRATDAAVLLGYGNERLRKSGASRGTTERRGYERASGICERLLEPRERELCLEEGAMLDEDEAARLALDLTSEIVEPSASSEAAPFG